MSRPTDAPPRGRFRRIVGYASLALVAFLVIAGFRGFRDLTLVREREAELEQMIGDTETEIDRLERRIDRLRTDPVMLERLAREELGMIRPGEVVILVEPEVPPGATSTEPLSAPSSGPLEPESP